MKKSTADVTLYCGQWHRTSRRYCSATKSVQLYREGFRCSAHKGSPPAAWATGPATRGEAA